MTKKPVIGVTEPSQFTEDCIFTIENFFKANPIKLCQNEQEDIFHWVDQCDGIILAGGIDIHPRTYGYAVLNEYGFSKFDIKRDYREINIINRCFEKNIPILGICRGHQMLGIYHGLQMVQDLTGTLICHQPIRQQISHHKDEPMHWVRLSQAANKTFEPHDCKAAIFCNSMARDQRYLWVNSFHHQGLLLQDREGRVDVLGWAHGHKNEKIVELMKGRANRWISCQWHPEYDWSENQASSMVLHKFQELMQGKHWPKHVFKKKPKPVKV